MALLTSLDAENQFCRLLRLGTKQLLMNQGRKRILRTYRYVLLVYGANHKCGIDSFIHSLIVEKTSDSESMARKLWTHQMELYRPLVHKRDY